jgi:hypothetical protein
MEYDIVHGVVVRLDPAWLQLWRVSQSLTPADWGALDRYLSYMFVSNQKLFGMPWRGFPASQMDLAWMLGSQEISQFAPVRVDPQWTCDTWKHISEMPNRDRRGPFVINVLVLPRSPRGAFQQLASSLGESTEHVRFEARPIARAFSIRKALVRPVVGGISLGTDFGDYGTLGGVLRSKEGILYGLTCGHVIGENDEAKQPSPRDVRDASRIGVCVESTGGHLHGPSARCNMKAALNELDIALIALDKDPPTAVKLEIMGLGQLARWATIDDVDEQSPVQVSGRSGCRSLYTGSIVAVAGVLIRGDRYCFRNLIEIKRTSAAYWGITGTLAPPVKRGDSGAWVIQDGPEGLEWSGMVIGGAGPVGYAVFAENVLEWLKSKGYRSLSVA